VVTKIQDRMERFHLLKYGTHGTGSLGNARTFRVWKNLPIMDKFCNPSGTMLIHFLPLKEENSLHMFSRVGSNAGKDDRESYFSRWNRSIPFHSIPDFSNHPH